MMYEPELHAANDSSQAASGDFSQTSWMSQLAFGDSSKTFLMSQSSQASNGQQSVK